MTQYQRARTRIGRLLNAWWIWPVIAGFIIGFALYGASDARADGVLDRAEADYAITYGPTVICPFIDAYPNAAGVLAVLRGIQADGFAGDSSVDIVNVSVSDFCPRHFPLLQAMGRAARSAQEKVA